MKAFIVTRIAHENRSRRRLVTIAIGAILLFFFSIPIGFILYGGAATALGGIGVWGLLVVLQIPTFLLFKKMGWIPPVDRTTE